MSDWSSDVCSSDLLTDGRILSKIACIGVNEPLSESERFRNARQQTTRRGLRSMQVEQMAQRLDWRPTWLAIIADIRSEEHTSELQSLMRISYAVFCLKKKKKKQHIPNNIT